MSSDSSNNVNIATSDIFVKSGTVRSLSWSASSDEPIGTCWSRDVLPIDSDDNSPGTGQPVYRYMATVAGRYVHIFQVTLHKETKGPSKESFRSGPFEIVQSYEDPNTQEAFYRCVFAGKCLAKPVMLSAEFTATTTGSSPIKQDSFLTTTEHESSCSMEQPTPVYNPRRERKKLTNLEETSTPSLFPNKPNPRNACNELLCVAGKNGCIKVIDTQRLLQLYELYHTDEVWDLQRSPANDWVIVSASKDTSVKVWDLESGGMLLYVLAGHGGHRDGVISAAWHPSGEWVATAGFDTCIKIWHVERACRQSSRIRRDNERSSFQFEPSRDVAAERQHFPAFSSNQLHNSAVDTVSFLGNLVMSKSMDESIELWRPCGLFESHKSPSSTTLTDYRHLRHFHIPFKHIIWYVQFAVDPSCRWLAAGNDKGEVHIWDIFNSATDAPRQILRTARHHSSVRDVKFSRDGTILVATNDTGIVTKWDLADLQFLKKK